MVNHIKRERRRELIEHLGPGCMVCKYSRCLRNLTFHHMVEETKEFGLCEREFSMKWDVLLHEAKKCVVLCHNCHGEVHEGLIQVNDEHMRVLDLLKSFSPSPDRSHREKYKANFTPT